MDQLEQISYGDSGSCPRPFGGLKELALGRPGIVLVGGMTPGILPFARAGPLSAAKWNPFPIGLNRCE